MQGILIGDVGSTNAHWAWLGVDHEITFHTSGYNPVMHQDEALHVMLKSVRDQIPDGISHIHYYGTGIISDGIRQFIIHNCAVIFDKTDVICESDMLAAARALSPGKEAIICILGTGSNSCHFDGERIIGQIPSLGFPLGDEGSGADIGMACVRAYYYGLMPDDLRGVFAQVLPLDRSVFLERYHHHPAPNRFLAELVPIIAENPESEFIQILLKGCFRSFVRQHIKPYQLSVQVYFSGSVAHAFREQLVDILSAENLTPGTIVKSPLVGLIEYHKKTTS